MQDTTRSNDPHREELDPIAARTIGVLLGVVILGMISAIVMILTDASPQLILPTMSLALVAIVAAVSMMARHQRLAGERS